MCKFCEFVPNENEIPCVIATDRAYLSTLYEPTQPFIRVIGGGAARAIDVFVNYCPICGDKLDDRG